MQGMTRITTDLPTDLVEFVKEYKKKTGISQSRIYTEALKLLKKEIENAIENGHLKKYHYIFLRNIEVENGTNK